MINSVAKKNFYLIFILGLLIAIGALSIDRYLSDIPGKCQRAAHGYIAGPAIVIQLYYWHFCRKSGVWSAAGTPMAGVMACCAITALSVFYWGRSLSIWPALTPWKQMWRGLALNNIGYCSSWWNSHNVIYTNSY